MQQNQVYNQQQYGQPMNYQANQQMVPQQPQYAMPNAYGQQVPQQQFVQPPQQQYGVAMPPVQPAVPLNAQQALPQNLSYLYNAMGPQQQQQLIAYAQQLYSQSVQSQSPPISTSQQQQAPIDPAQAALRQSRSSLRGMIGIPSAQRDPNNVKPEKTIIFIGPNGAGKSSSINSMINFLHKVDYDEPFRYELVAKSVGSTHQINKYYLNDLKQIDYALNIVDTPGFGDNDGNIRMMFKNLFKELESIDLICYTMPSHETRSATFNEQQVFKNMVQNFGKEIKPNTFVLFTFADNSEPPALPLLKTNNVAYSAKFQINNAGFSSIPQPNQPPNMMQKMQFDEANKQFQAMFDQISNLQIVKKVIKPIKIPNDQLTQFLGHYHLEEYNRTLRTVGLASFEMLDTLSQEDIENLMEEANLKYALHKTAFLNGIKSVKNGTYPPPKISDADKAVFESRKYPFNAKVITKYERQHKNQLTVRVDDKLTIERFESGWFYAKNADGQNGYILTSRVKEVEEKKAEPAPKKTESKTSKKTVWCPYGCPMEDWTIPRMGFACPSCCLGFQLGAPCHACFIHGVTICITCAAYQMKFSSR